MAQGRDIFSKRSIDRANYFDTDRSYYADPEYQLMTRQLLKQGNIGFDFYRYRIKYMQSSWYDPIGEKIISELDNLSKRALNGEIGAFELYRELLTKHLAHIDVVLFAQEKSKEDKRFGSAKIYDRVARGIVQNVLASGNGNTPEDAFDIITFGEETMLFAQLGLRPLSTEHKVRGMREFNHYIVEEVGTGKKREVFINVYYPMSKIRFDKAREEDRRNPLERR